MNQADGDQALGAPEAGAVSGEALIVPASAVEYIATDLPGSAKPSTGIATFCGVHHEPVRHQRPPGA